jgi:dUTP pyrophosphatase
MCALRLFIAPVNNEFAELYRSAADAYNRMPEHERSSGFDLFCDINDIDTKYSTHAYLVGQGCRALAMAIDGSCRAYWLAPRSSISRTPFRIANSQGLIDAPYRGIVRAAIWSIDPVNDRLDKHQRLCQLVAGDLLPWSEVIVIDELPGPVTLRGSGGFGSTGK